MVYPVANSYSAASGATVWAGRVAPVSIFAGDGIVFGDSLTDLSYASAPYRWALPLTMRPPRIIFNAGIQNHTLQNMIDRVAADVIARAPAFVFFRGGTNSLGLSTATYRAQYRQLLDLMLDAGIFVFAHAVPPKTGVAGSTIVAHNAWVAAECAADPDRLKYVGDCDDLGDGTYTYKSSHFIDGIHMNGVGQHAAGVAMASIIAPFFAAHDPRITDATDKYPSNPTSNQYVQNPHMAGTGGTKGSNTTGTVPNNWSVGCNGGGTAAVASIIAADVGDPVQVPWLRIQVASVGAANHSMTASTRLAHPAIAADATIKRFDSVAEVRMVGLDPTTINALSLFIDASSVNVAQLLQMKMGAFEVQNTNAVMRHSFERTQGTAGSSAALAAYAANSLDLNISFSFSAAAASPIGYLDIRCASVRGQTT